MKIKTSELTDRALNHCVHLALGYSYRNDDKYGPMYMWPSSVKGVTNWENWPANYGNDWAHGGPIIDRMVKDGLQLYNHNPADGSGTVCTAVMRYSGHHHSGPTPLIAAMRCFVASKLGDEVDIPKELL